MARKFLFVCLGFLILSVAFHLGARTATSQGNGTPTGAAAVNGYVYVITDTGDCYRKFEHVSDPHNWEYWGNIHGGAATEPTTWGGMKARWHEEE